MNNELTAVKEESDDICDIHNKVEVPDVTGKSTEEARAIFEELFIETTEVSEYNETFNHGIVFDQSPPPGSFLESLTGEKLSIILYVSKGEQTFEMPDLIGFKLGKAEDILSSLEVEIEEVINEFSDLQPEDYIFDQSPSKDSLITKSTSVTVYVSKGENPEGTIPDLIGLTEEEALDTLSLAGFENVTVVIEGSDEEKSVRQLLSGINLSKGAAIILQDMRNPLLSFQEKSSLFKEKIQKISFEIKKYLSWSLASKLRNST